MKYQKKTAHVALLLSAGALVLTSVYFSTKHQMQLQQTQATQQSKQTSLYYGTNVDMSQLLPDSQHYIKNDKGEDLIDLGHRLGMNMFRIVSGRKSYSGEYKPYTQQQWKSVLDKLQSYNMKAIILVESPPQQKDFYQGIFTESHIDLMQDLVIDSNIGNHPAVFAIDLKNEPILSDEHLILLKEQSELIKKAYPHLHITVGGWRIEETLPDGKKRFIWNKPEHAPLLKDIVTLYSLHIYDFDKPVNGVYHDPKKLMAGYINDMKARVGSTPMIVGEFGADNGDAITDQVTLGSKELQANIYHDIYTYLEESNSTLGAISYDFISRNGKPDGWAIAKDKGNYLYPAAYVLQLHAKGSSEIPLILPFTSLPKQRIVTIEDAGKTVTIDKNTILGLTLRINWNRHMKLEGNTEGILEQTAPLYYEGPKYLYYAVFHPKQSGKTTLRLMLQTGCTTDYEDEVCPGPMEEKFSTTIEVQ
jgi:hypothetical protein